MGDRCIPPVEHPQSAGSVVEVRVMEVVVLNCLGDAASRQVGTQLGEPGCEALQLADFLYGERQVDLQELLVARREGCEPQIGDAVGEMVPGARSLAALQFGVT